MQAKPTLSTDIAIVGGGIAGLWLLNLLSRQGFEPILCEADAMGSGQTLASQGMIHGGIKYALGGRLTMASETISTMPARWQACLEGRGEIDLSGTEILSDHYYMWANQTLGKLGSLLASKLLRGRVARLARVDYPKFFHHPEFTGSLYQLDERVLDPYSLMNELCKPVYQRILAQEVSPQNLELADDGSIQGLSFTHCRLEADVYILAAGAGNAALIEAMRSSVRTKREEHGAPQMSPVAEIPYRQKRNLPAPSIPPLPFMQRRPLQQVLVKPHLQENFEPRVFAHYLDGLDPNGPRLTLTTHRLKDAQQIWYVGGQFASEGAQLTTDTLIALAQQELSRALPWLDLSRAEYKVYPVERAEPEQTTRQRPADAWVSRHGNSLICWPTKLTLVPRLGDRVKAELTHLFPGKIQPDTGGALPVENRKGIQREVLERLFPIRPVVAKPPWEKFP